MTIQNQSIRRGNGYGQYVITGTVNGVEVTTITTDSEAFDYFNDDENEEKHEQAKYHVDMKLEMAFEKM